MKSYWNPCTYWKASKDNSTNILPFHLAWVWRHYLRQWHRQPKVEQCKWDSSMLKWQAQAPEVIAQLHKMPAPILNMKTFLPIGVGTDSVLAHDSNPEIIWEHSVSKIVWVVKAAMKSLNPKSFFNATLNYSFISWYPLRRFFRAALRKDMLFVWPPLKFFLNSLNIGSTTSGLSGIVAILIWFGISIYNISIYVIFSYNIKCIKCHISDFRLFFNF